MEVLAAPGPGFTVVTLQRWMPAAQTDMTGGEAQG